jgi:chemotaxis protein MotB
VSKKRHAHHGGAWKVAYADFVTAMMALFLVLWLTAQDVKVKEAIERAFKNPFMSVTKDSTGVIPNKDSQAVRSSSGNFDSASAVELNMLRKLSQDLIRTLQSNPDNPDDNVVNLELTPDGMRISVFDKNRHPIFDTDSAEFTDYGKWVFSTLAWELSRYADNFLIELEGHTEKGYKPKSEEYGSWELTSDRANSARRRLTLHGVADSQIRRVAGYSDTAPLPKTVPTSEMNRRVTVLLRIKTGKNQT